MFTPIAPTCDTYRGEEKFVVLVSKPGGKIQFGRNGGRGGNTIKVDHKETGWKDVKWILLS
jgi:hypothetical protein